MATSGKAYAISVAIYVAILAVVTILFSVWRRLAFTRKFFAPKRYVTEEGYLPPSKLPDSFLGWVGSVFKASEAEVIAAAGIDAALYIKFIRMGWETFMLISFVVLVIILPINLTNDTVDQLMASQSLPPGPPSQYTYWISPPPPPPPTSPGASPAPPKETAKSDLPKAPDFYNDTYAPPAPYGLEWHLYAEGVPTLPPAPPEYVWYYDSSYVPNNYMFTDLDKCTLSNVPARSPKLYAHAIITWVVTIIVFVQLWRYCREALRLRMFYLLNTPRGSESHTVLVTDIPAVAVGTIPNRLDGTLLKFVPKSIKDQAFKQVAELDNPAAALASAAEEGVVKATGVDGAAGADTTAGAAMARANSAKIADALSSNATRIDAVTGRWEIPDRWQQGVGGVATEGSVHAMVDDEFKKVYREDFSHSHMAYDTTTLDGLVAAYETTKMAAQDLVDDYISKKQRGLELKPKQITVTGATMGAWGREKYGLKPTKVDAFEFYQDRLTYLREEIASAQKEAKQNVYPSAFVTFHRRTAQVVAAGALMCEDLSAWTVQAAPRPEEVLWKSLFMRTWERTGRGALMWVAFTALTLFYLIPVAAVQALLSTNSLIGWIEDIPIVSSVITAILPGLVLAIFIALLPPIITAMNKFAGMISTSQVDLGLMTRFFIFQCVTVFFGSFIAGSAANQFNELINDPSNIVTLLGTSAPQTSIFFMTYTTLRGLFIIPFSILRLVPFIIFWVKSKFLAATERAKARLWQNQLFSYGTVVPNDTIIILLGLTFCVINPIIAPVTVIYFTTSYIVRKHDLLYVFRQPYQAGGMAWPRMFGQICTGLIIFQLVMICLLALKKSVGGPIIIIPLLFFTFYYMSAAAATFWRPMEALSLMAASELDTKEANPLLIGGGGDRAAAGTADGDALVKSQDPTGLYLSPAFDVDDQEHAQTVDDCKRLKAVLDGGEDEKLFQRDAVTEAHFSEELELGDEIAAAGRASMEEDAEIVVADAGGGKAATATDAVATTV